MGIIKAFAGATGGTMADQWLEMYCCDSIPQGILALRGQKQVSERSSNTKGDPNIISDGSVVVVNEGQSAIAVEQGKVIGCYREPGEHIFHGGSASLFSGGGMKGIGKDILTRVGFGGDAAIHQFILYIDMKEQMGNPFSVNFPIRVTDEEIGLRLTATARAEGVFSFRITDPMIFYQRICRGANGTMKTSDLLPQLQGEFATAMMEAASKVFTGSLRLSDLPGKVSGIADTVSGCMTAKWVELRGFTVVSTAIESLTVYDRDLHIIQKIQREKTLRDPAMAAATLTGAQADAMNAASQNAGGGFVIVSPVNSPSPVNPAPLPDVSSAPTVQKLPKVTSAPTAQPLQNRIPAPDNSDRPKLWYCPNCRRMRTTKFCPDCGAKRED